MYTSSSSVYVVLLGRWLDVIMPTDLFCQPWWMNRTIVHSAQKNNNEYEIRCSLRSQVDNNSCRSWSGLLKDWKRQMRLSILLEILPRSLPTTTQLLFSISSPHRDVEWEIGSDTMIFLAIVFRPLCVPLLASATKLDSEVLVDISRAVECLFARLSTIHYIVCLLSTQFFFLLSTDFPALFSCSVLFPENLSIQIDSRASSSRIHLIEVRTVHWAVLVVVVRLKRRDFSREWNKKLKGKREKKN